MEADAGLMYKTAMNRFIGDKPWSQITALAKQSPHTCVAVPYLHGEANRILPLKRGDVLKVNIMSCQVNPDELLKYQQKGVRLYTSPFLHAKVFVFGKTAIIGSTNVSYSSENKLTEAVVATTDKAVVAAARKFIDELDSLRVNDSWLQRCREVYKKPSGFGGANSSERADAGDRWCRKLMKLVAPGSVERNGLNFYFISLAGDRVKRAALTLDQSEEEGAASVVLRMWPADTPSQAKALYPTCDEDAVLALQREGWEIHPNLHFGFAAGGLCWIDSPMQLREYLRFWKANSLPIDTIRRSSSRNVKPFRSFFRKLHKMNLVSRGDLTTLNDNFTRTKRKSFQIRPGLAFQYMWPCSGSLPPPGSFASTVRARINEALKVCSQPPI